MLEKGKLYYIVADNDVEAVEFIKECNSQQVWVKRINNNKEYCVDSYYVVDTKEQAYIMLLSWLESDKQEVEEGIEDLKEELNRINEVIKNLKQKYEQ